MKITTTDCKKAIVEHIKANPGCVSSQFVSPEDEEPAKLEKNWKRMTKMKCPNTALVCWCRSFDCKPYDDQLRAYVWSTDTEITHVKVVGE